MASSFRTYSRPNRVRKDRQCRHCRGVARQVPQPGKSRLLVDTLGLVLLVYHTACVPSMEEFKVQIQRDCAKLQRSKLFGRSGETVGTETKGGAGVRKKALFLVLVHQLGPSILHRKVVERSMHDPFDIVQAPRHQIQKESKRHKGAVHCSRCLKVPDERRVLPAHPSTSTIKGRCVQPTIRTLLLLFQSPALPTILDSFI